jgi:formamidopyrimidine-DNA glycosylase
MPELPDLNVFSHNLTKLFSGKKIYGIEIYYPGKLNASTADIKKSLLGATLSKVSRDGKELRFIFDNGAVLGLHLMLHGQMDISDDVKPGKKTIAALTFDNKSSLIISDFMRQAKLTLNPPSSKIPDALSKKITKALLKKMLREVKASNIKAFLTDQHIIRGIGNAYADEILWMAGIAPASHCDKIPDKKIESLNEAIKSVLRDAEEQIKKTDPDLISGEIRHFLKVHNSKKSHSPTGDKIKIAQLNSRKTYYTDEQQEFC